MCASVGWHVYWKMCGCVDVCFFMYMGGWSNGGLGHMCIDVFVCCCLGGGKMTKFSCVYVISIY